MIRSPVWLGQVVGVIGTVAFVFLYASSPSFPTPDKLIVFFFLFFMIFKQAWFVFTRLAPFVLILLVYDSFRGIADELNTHVNYTLPAAADRFLFGDLPTVTLQNWLWHGQVRWYDFMFYLPYFLHFVLPVGLAIVVWKTRQAAYWRYVTAFSLVSFAAFFTFLLFPAAPPWLGSEQAYVEPLQRISSDVWFRLGISDFPSVYNQISPNPVAAVPSLHVAWAVLLLIFVGKLYGRRWGMLTLFYPLLLIFGVVYQGEHYVFDVLAGMAYALGAYASAPYIVRFSHRKISPLLQRYRQAKLKAKQRMYSASSK
ncbi:phosphatase PAP2 family protein [Candidatus Saccharibacteria bacterium]|nr:phosphatase PAP2 family protein [Candidatus Saccharibacteria bacterium]